MQIPTRTIDDAPEASRAPLKAVTAKYGFTPNILAKMANSPPVLKAYIDLSGLLSQTCLTPTEQQTVLLTVSRENNCRYCVAAHSVIAPMQGVQDDVVDAIRERRPIGDEKLEALSRFTAEVVTTRGWPSDQAKQALEDAGYTPAQALEVVLGVTMKTLSNYVNHLAHTELDDAFAAKAWEPGEPGDTGEPGGLTSAPNAQAFASGK